MTSMTVSFTDESTGFTTEVIVEEVDGALVFTVNVITDGSTNNMTGDLRALYFELEGNVNDMDLSIDGDPSIITDTKIKEEGVSTLGGDTNINGEVINENGKFDIGVEFGSQGIGKNDIQSATFTLSSDSGALTLDDLGTDFGLRVTSVGPDGESRQGSLKLDGTVEWNLSIDALDDAYVIGENDSINDNICDDDQFNGSLAQAGEIVLTGAALVDANGNMTTMVVGQAVEVTTAGGRTCMITVNADGTFTFDGMGNFTEMMDGDTDSLRIAYTIEPTADSLISDTAYVDVTINGEGTPNLAPVAIDDANAGNEDAASISGNVLVNDSDPDGDAISVVSAGGQAVGSVIAVSGVSSGGLALDGTLTVNANGSYSFVPGAGYTAMAVGESISFSVDYTISDPAGLTDTANLTITVNGLNEGPVATANAYSTDEGVALAGNILSDDTGNGIDSDPNGDAISVVDVKSGGVSLGAMGDSWAVTSDNGRTGTLTVNADGSFTFQPDASFDNLSTGESDTITLSYTIEDTHGAASSASFVIDVQGTSGGGGGGGGPAINVMFVVDASSSMFVDNGLGLAVGDVNGDGVANTSFDLAYMGVQDFIAELQAEAATLGVDLNVGLTGFDDGAVNGGGFDFSTFTYDATTGLSGWNSDVYSAGGAGDSVAVNGLARGAGWFTAMGASMSDDNQMIMLTDGGVDTAGSAAAISDFQTDFGGDVHGRYVGTISNLSANYAALAGVIDTLDSTALDPYLNSQMWAYDEVTMDLALTTSDVLSFV